MMISVVHDIAECIVGDITPKDKMTPEEKHEKEMAAMKELVEKLPDTVASNLYTRFKRYEDQLEDDTAAHLTKDIDKLDMIIQALEYEREDKNRGPFLQEFFDSTRGVFITEIVQKLDKYLEEKRKKFIEENSSAS